MRINIKLLMTEIHSGKKLREHRTGYLDRYITHVYIREIYYSHSGVYLRGKIYICICISWE